MVEERNKTEIDFSKDFLWFDDDCFYGEKQELLEHNKLDNWIEVDLGKNLVLQDNKLHIEPENWLVGERVQKVHSARHRGASVAEPGLCDGVVLQ